MTEDTKPEPAPKPTIDYSKVPCPKGRNKADWDSTPPNDGNKRAYLLAVYHKLEGYPVEDDS